MQVEKPSKEAHEKNLAEITAEFEKQKTERQGIQKQIEEIMNKGKGSPIGKEREAFQQLLNKKRALIKEKQAIRGEMETLNTAADKLNKDKKDAKSGVRFGSAAEIDAEIARLQKLHETTSMSLTEEKKLIKEMDMLKASKEKIKDVASKDMDLADVKARKRAINEQMTAKNKEIDAVSKDMDALKAKIDAMSEKEKDKRGDLDGLFKKRDQLKKDIAVTLKKKDAARDENRKQMDAWWNYSRALKAQKQMQYEAEKAKRDEERQEFLKKREEEEAKKIPYEEEQGLCDYLADYLERTYLSKDNGEAKVSAKKEEVIAVKDDPFANFKPVKKENDEDYFGKGKGGKKQKKRQRADKKKEAPAAGPFVLNVDSFEQFGLLGLNPPTSLEQVEGSVKELREKKEWYKQQPRGSVPTAKDIRKQNEKNAAKLRQSGQSSSSGSTSKGGKFSLSSDDFAPLGKGASNAVDASSWGQKPPASAAEEGAADGDAAPAAEES